MSAWLNIVKKHTKLPKNKGKSLKEYLPDAKKEYDMLKKTGKIVLKASSAFSKKVRKTKKLRKTKKINKGGNRSFGNAFRDVPMIATYKSRKSRNKNKLRSKSRTKIGGDDEDDQIAIDEVVMSENESVKSDN